MASSQQQQQFISSLLAQWDDEEANFSSTELQLLEDIESFFDQQPNDNEENENEDNNEQQKPTKQQQQPNIDQSHLVATSPPPLTEHDFYQTIMNQSQKVGETNRAVGENQTTTTTTQVLPFNDPFYGLSQEKKSLIHQLIQYKTIGLDLSAQVQQTIQICDELRSQYNAVCQKTATLHQDCERLVGEKNELLLISNGIKSALDHFNDMKEFSDELDAGKQMIAIDLFSKSLKQLDESLDFLLQNRDFREAKSYISRYRMLQSRALAQLRDQVITVLSSVTDSVLVRLNQMLDAKDLSISSVITLIYVQFWASIEFLKEIIHEIELRSYTKNEYSVFIMDCFDCYIHTRSSLVHRTVKAKVQSLLSTGQHDLRMFVQDGILYLLRICSEEDELLKHFFSGGVHHRHSMILSAYGNFIGSLCKLVSDGLRVMLHRESSISVLSDVIDILRTEVLLDDGTMPRGISSGAFEPVVHQMIHDVQERLNRLSAVK